MGPPQSLSVPEEYRPAAIHRRARAEGRRQETRLASESELGRQPNTSAILDSIALECVSEAVLRAGLLCFRKIRDEDFLIGGPPRTRIIKGLKGWWIPKIKPRLP